MKKLSLNDFAKTTVLLEKKGMKSVKGGVEEKPKPNYIVIKLTDVIVSG
jgi:hypothetical protein